MRRLWNGRVDQWSETVATSPAFARLRQRMLDLSLDRHHRQVLADKASAMLRRGPSGWWRLLKNIVRIGSGRGRLHPCAPDWWTQALQAAQYTAVRYEHVSSEAGIVVGTRPE